MLLAADVALLVWSAVSVGDHLALEITHRLIVDAIARRGMSEAYKVTSKERDQSEKSALQGRDYLETLLTRHGLPPLPLEPALGADGRLRAALGSSLAAQVTPGSFEALTLALALAVFDVNQAAQTASLIARVQPPARPETMLEARGSRASQDLIAARSRLIAALAAFASALADRSDAPEVGEALAELRAVADRLPEKLGGGAAAADSLPENLAVGAGELVIAARWATHLVRHLLALSKGLELPPRVSVIGAPTAAEDAALRAILEHPDDDQARLAWAALAGARGEPRAQLVREQMKTRAERRARSWSVPTSPATVSLLRRHPEWEDEARTRGATGASLHRGFVEWIAIDAATFLARGAELRAAVTADAGPPTRGPRREDSDARTPTRECGREAPDARPPTRECGREDTDAKLARAAPA